MRNERLAQEAKEARDAAGLTTQQIADAMDVCYNTAWRVMRGDSLSADMLARFAEAVGQPERTWYWIALGRPRIPTLGIVGQHGLDPQFERLGVPDVPDAPIRGTVSAGVVSLRAVEEGTGQPTRITMTAEADYALRVVDSGLHPYIMPGDVLLVREAERAVVGQLVVIEANPGPLVVRYLGRQGGQQRFRHVNPTYPPLDADDAVILGVVIGRWTDSRALAELGK